MLDLFDLFRHAAHLFRLHIFHDYQAESTFIKVLHENILPLHGLHAVRKICEHVIIHSHGKVSDHRRDQ